MGQFSKLHMAVGLLLTGTALADPLSTSRPVDFFREISSRHLHGMATRSDGRLLAGPAVRTLKMDLGTDLLWSLSAKGDELLIGTGPEGRLLSVDLHAPAGTKPKVVLELPGTHIFSMMRLPSGDILAGTSPDGGLVLARDGKILAQVKLPVSSVLDIKLLPASGDKTDIALVATGNPGRIYRVETTKLVKAGTVADGNLAAAGITVWGAVRDENVRRLLVQADGTVIAGSAPKGNVYQFSGDGGPPLLLDENVNAEVTALLPWDDGFYAAITFTNETRETRVKRANGNQGQAKSDEEKPAEGDSSSVVVVPSPPPANFRGRSQLIWYPRGGFPEVVATRNNTAFYDLARHEDTVLITGGEEGELLGYNPEIKRSYTFAGATASQVNAIASAGGLSGKYYLLGNNPGTLEVLDFDERGEISAETGRIDLGVMSTIGALRFERPVVIPSDQLKVELRASFGSDELEGWTPWQTAAHRDGGWSVPGLRGRYVQLRLSSQDPAAEFARGTLYSLPQNRRPQLQNFQMLSPNFALLPAPPRADRAGTSLGQILQAGSKSTDGKSRDAFLSSEVIPQPGTQVAFWAVNDPDGDNYTATFSLRPVDASEWTDVLVNSPEDYAQFEISNLPEGIYQTRLTVTETSPRPREQRLATTFETDDLLVDRTPPKLLEVTAIRQGNGCRILVHAHDALSLLRGVELKLNNGASFDLEQPIDGILDGQEETFALELTGQQLDNSTSAEVVAIDQAGNSAARRITLPQ